MRQRQRNEHPPEIVRSRMVLSAAEQEDARSLGEVVATALESGVEAWRPGVTSDYEVASEISRELERHGAKAVCLIVGGDDRLRTLRHPLAIGAVVREALMAVVVARRGGLHVAATRTAVTRDDDPIIELTERLGPVRLICVVKRHLGSQLGRRHRSPGQGL